MDDVDLRFPTFWPEEVCSYFRALDVERHEWLRSVDGRSHSMQRFVDYCETIRVLDTLAEARCARDGSGAVFKAVRVAWAGPPPSETERWQVVRQISDGEGLWWQRPRTAWSGGRALSETFPLDVFDGLQMISRQEFDSAWRDSHHDVPNRASG